MNNVPPDIELRCIGWYFTLTRGSEVVITKGRRVSRFKTQRLRVGIIYILEAQKGSHIITLGPKYILHAVSPNRRPNI